MRAQNLLSRPWFVAAVIGAVVVTAVEATLGTGGSGVALGLLGALVGVIALPIATQLGLLLGSALFGLRVRHVVFGAMRRVASWQAGRVTITVRALPVTLSAEIGPWRSPVVLRCWLAGLVSALAGIAAAVGAWTLAELPFGRGAALAATPLMLYKLWPRRAPMATSTGWLLFGLPRMPRPERDEFRAAPMAARAYEALRAGDVDGSRAHVDELVRQHPDLNATVSCRVSLHEACGEYAQACLLLLDHLSGRDAGPREMSYLLAGMAGLGFAAVEAEQLPPDDLLPLAKKALDDAIRLGYPEFQLSGTKGLLALLEGEPDEAARLAAIGAEHNTSPLSRADDFATLARAHMAKQDNAAARAALARAEDLAPWWPRVVETHQRLHVA
ncbi:hypothetical protein [Saccharopolyspora cebuensis]|uniref:Tetratricopeptide repeat protein n=1 Tax=Saccharopolyspora cebuensis TaxID=418759 RepID=A0ABV4CCC0_9PSEU